jgi:hypothetical protein
MSNIDLSKNTGKAVEDLTEHIEEMFRNEVFATDFLSEQVKAGEPTVLVVRRDEDDSPLFQMVKVSELAPQTIRETAIHAGVCSGDSLVVIMNFDDGTSRVRTFKSAGGM